MPGEFGLYDATRTNPIAADYLDGVAAGSNSADSIVWVKNIGSAQITAVVVSVEQVPGNDGNTFIKLSEGIPVASPGSLTATKQAGTIAGPKTLYYKVSALGVGNGPSLPSAAASESILAAENSYIELVWAAVPNALGYVVYVSDDGINFYKKDEIVGTGYLDTDGVVDVTQETPPTLNQAFRAGTFVAGPISIGDLDPNDMRPIIFRAEVPLGTTPAGNTRVADIVVEGDTA